MKAPFSKHFNDFNHFSTVLCASDQTTIKSGALKNDRLKNDDLKNNKQTKTTQFVTGENERVFNAGLSGALSGLTNSAISKSVMRIASSSKVGKVTGTVFASIAGASATSWIEYYRERLSSKKKLPIPVEQLGTVTKLTGISGFFHTLPQTLRPISRSFTRSIVTSALTGGVAKSLQEQSIQNSIKNANLDADAQTQDDIPPSITPAWMVNTTSQLPKAITNQIAYLSKRNLFMGTLCSVGGGVSSVIRLHGLNSLANTEAGHDR